MGLSVVWPPPSTLSMHPLIFLFGGTVVFLLFRRNRRPLIYPPGPKGVRHTHREALGQVHGMGRDVWRRRLFEHSRSAHGHLELGESDE